MQARRAFSALAAKIHPQLPLTPRESQQLLNLLTASFRSHLEREHPTFLPDIERGADPSQEIRYHVAHEDHANSSQHATHKHIGSILSNPLLTGRPRRQQSASDVSNLMRDPKNWFLDHVAMGTADVEKSFLCLGVLSEAWSARKMNIREARAATAGVLEWLRTSKADVSSAFVDASSSSSNKHKDHSAQPRLSRKLLALVINAGQEHHLWRWLSRSFEHQLRTVCMERTQVAKFQSDLVKHLMQTKLHLFGLESAIIAFNHAHEMTKRNELGPAGKALAPAGAAITEWIMAHPDDRVPMDHYDGFMSAVSSPFGSWNPAVQAMLSLRHPTAPNAMPGLLLLTEQSSWVARQSARGASRRRLLAQLNLEVAHQLLSVADYANAKLVLEIAQKNYPEFMQSGTTEKLPGVGRNAPRDVKAAFEEQRNLNLLDGLLPT